MTAFAVTLYDVQKMVTFGAAINPPAAGAPITQIVIATFLACVITGALAWLAAGHVSGRSQVLARIGALGARATGMPIWAGLPFLIVTAGLITGGFGVFWDISLHIDEGRDEGPLANLAHYPILLCLFSIFTAGVISAALYQRAEDRVARPIRLPGGHEIPVSAALLVLCGAVGLSGFPMDDAWHRMFGQDVTLWGPTHLVMINGAILSIFVGMVLVTEARLATGRRLAQRSRRIGTRLTRVLLPATVLFAFSFWASEFDWGVPQYRLVWHPLLLACGSALALVAARVWVGPGGAIGALVVYLVSRSVIGLAVLGLGQTMPLMPLFIAEALCVELAARGARPEERPLRFGLIAGALCGTAGFAAEYAWTQAVYPYPWTPALLAEGIPTALAAGLAGGVLGGLLGAALRGELPAPALRRRAGVAAAATLIVLGANALWTTDPSGVEARVALDPVGGDSGERAVVTARIDGSNPAGAEWFRALAWQGGGTVVSEMKPVGDGRWRSTEALPVGGDWKTLLRLQDGRVLANVPLHIPPDSAVPYAGVKRPERFTAAFVPDIETMQVERRDFVPGWLWTPAALAMLMICAGMVVAIATGFTRVLEAPRPRRQGSIRRRLPALARLTSRI